jgi:hypothetical protein
MNGYSVEEAAEVLGIPQGRVWELIARGVLAGAAEGGASMRVYLKGTTPTPTVAGTESDETSHANGNGNGANHGELSPFRELLTEFRNLTERYGQALLALGEARGEVASLRSRVDLLEARMDMRLPMRAASTVAWEMPAHHAPPAGRGAEPAVPEAPPAPEDAAEPSLSATGPTVESPATPGGRPRRYGTRDAVAGLAEALARAEDPTLSSLPGASEAAEALAALQQQVEATEPPATEPPATEPTEPVEPMPDEPPPTTLYAEELMVGEDVAMAAELDELAALAPSIELAEEEVGPAATEPETVQETVAADVHMAEDVRVDAAEPVEAPEAAPHEASDSPYTTDVIEPDWFADGDFAWLESPAPEPEGPPAPQAPGEPVGLEIRAEEQPTGDAEETVVTLDAEPAMEAGEAWSPEVDVPAPDEPITEEIQEAFEDAGPTRAEAIHIEPDDSGLTHRDDEPPSTEFRAEVAPRAAGFGLYRGQPEGPIEAAAGPQPATAVRDEEAVMWLGDDFEAGDLEQGTSGWQDGGAEPPHTPVEPAPLQLSDAEIEQLASSEGWDEEEVAAIRGLLGRAEPGPEIESPARAEPSPAAREGTTDRQQAIPIGEPQTRPASPQHRPSPIRPSNAGPEAADWLQGRRGPAATAYRRLRRIFQS